MSRLLYCSIGSLLLFACQSPRPEVTLNYPETRQDTTIADVYFGTRVIDPYRWLENDSSNETADWVKRQNTFTQAYLSSIPFRNTLKTRFSELYNFEKYSAPFTRGNYTYYYRNSGLQNQFVLYRESSGQAQPEVFLDPNTFSKDGTTSMSGLSFSKDGSLAAYNLSEGGSDWQKTTVINATTKTPLTDTVEVKFSRASWRGNTGFYYSSYPRSTSGNVLTAKNENHKLFFHRLGTPQSSDQVIFGDDAHPYRYVSGQVSEDLRWLIVSAANQTYGNALFLLNLNEASPKWITIVSNLNNSHEVVAIDDRNLYIQTDKDAPTGQVVVAPLTHPQQEYWKPLIPAQPEVLSTSSAGGWLFCSYLKDAVSVVKQYERSGKFIRNIPLPGLGTADGFRGQQQDTVVYFAFESYTSPRTIFRMNISSGATQLFKASQVKFNPDDYESKQVFYTSKDGTKIPMIITHKKGLVLNGKNPCLLYGYGGFSISLTPYFDIANLILLENGGVYAVPNIRGGGEYGEAWHQQGIQQKKQNVFDDFIAAAEYLKKENYTSTEYLALQGGSNGGLLVGACITQRPDLCRVAFPEVGVMDMLRYHKFTAGAGWSYDYGTADDSPEMFQYLYHYSPVHNVKRAAYPATLINTADHDDRVVPAHSFKFASQMQAHQTGTNPVLIRIETKAGHGSGMSTQQTIEMVTDQWSFFFTNMGIHPYER